jgi:hypothetical protein
VLVFESADLRQYTSGALLKPGQAGELTREVTRMRNSYKLAFISRRRRQGAGMSKLPLEGRDPVMVCRQYGAMPGVFVTCPY